MNSKVEDKRSRQSPKDRKLYAALLAGAKARTLTITVNAEHINRPGSPTWDPGENIAPLLGLLFISTVMIFAINLMVGIAVIVLGIILYVLLIRPWILNRVSARTLAAALDNFHNWNLLWRKGGLTIEVAGSDGPQCLSPLGDWRAFIAQRMPDVKIDGEENFAAFSQPADERSLPKTVLNAEM
jgi:hypothetical protein